MATALKRLDQVKIASGLSFLAALWVLVSPWVYTRAGAEAAPVASLWSNVVVACIVAVVSAIRFYTPERNAWLSWFNCLLGLWMLITPWVYAFTGIQARFYNNVVFGIVVAVLGAWAALESRGETLAGTPYAGKA